MASENQNANSEGIRGMVTVARAAEMLRVSSRRVLQFIQEGRLKGEQVTPRLWLVDASDVAKFAKQKRPHGRPAKKS